MNDKERKAIRMENDKINEKMDNLWITLENGTRKISDQIKYDFLNIKYNVNMKKLYPDV